MRYTVYYNKTIKTSIEADTKELALDKFIKVHPDVSISDDEVAIMEPTITIRKDE